MKVFIENESGSSKKNLFNEKTLEYKKTMNVSSEYPYPYGFILDTTSDDGDNLDCFVLTNKNLSTGQTVECEPIGLMEQFETSWNPNKKEIEEVDHNILAVLKGENAEIDDEIKQRLAGFVTTVFSHIPGKKIRVGQFLGRDVANKLIYESLD